MPVPNPFVDAKTGRIRFPDNGSLVRHVERWARCAGIGWPTATWISRPSAMVSTTIWHGRGSVHATAPSAPGCSRSPSRATASRSSLRRAWTTWWRSTARCTPASCGPAVRPRGAGAHRPAALGARRLRAVGDPDHHRFRGRRAPVLPPAPSGRGAAPRHRRRRDTRRGRQNLAAAVGGPGRGRLPAVHLRVHPCPGRCEDHPPGGGHQPGATHRRTTGRRGPARRHVAAAVPRHGAGDRDGPVGRRPLHHDHEPTAFVRRPRGGYGSSRSNPTTTARRSRRRRTSPSSTPPCVACRKTVTPNWI